VVCINECLFEFRRDVGNTHLSVSYGDQAFSYRAMSNDLDDFLRNALLPSYIFETDSESVLTLLDFCFLSEEKSANRRQQWGMISSIACINVSLLSSVEKDISSLKNEISKNKNLEKIVDDFSLSLSIKLSENSNITDLNKKIEVTKEQFFDEFRKKEDLLVNATLKFEEIKERSSLELKSKIAEIEDVFFNLSRSAGLEISNFDGLELFIKDRSKTMSYGQETFSRFLLVLAIAQLAQEGSYNFPQLIVNDSYVSFDHELTRRSISIMDDLIKINGGLQYIEFTYRDDIPKENIVLNLKTQGGLNAYNS